MSKTHGHNDHGFHCPGCISPNELGEFECKDCDCPKEIPTVRFSSPTSGLPPKELKRLEQLIHEANELLLLLGSESNEDFQIGLKQKFRKLCSQFVIVKVVCDEDDEDNDEKVEGIIKDAGIDFLVIDTIESIVFIPFERICSVKRREDEHGHENEKAEHGHHPQLLDIGPCFRKDLMLHFGKTVAKDPFLINLFFGIRLNLFLEQFVGKEIAVREEGEEMVCGLLAGVVRNSLLLEEKNSFGQINFDDVCFIKLLNEKHPSH